VKDKKNGVYRCIIICMFRLILLGQIKRKNEKCRTCNICGEIREANRIFFRKSQTDGPVDGPIWEDGIKIIVRET
jgi:MinD superfamily P-loop ATPase